jgi:hypothetical protein
MENDREKKRGPGRPQWIPKNLHEVEQLAAIGLTEAQIAYSLGICNDTLIRKKKEYSEFSEAIKRGQANGIGKVANKLFENAESGNVSAQIFYLKTRAGWKETKNIEVFGSIEKPPVTIANHEISKRISEILQKCQSDADELL